METNLAVESGETTPPSQALNTVLWVLQILAAAMFLLAGGLKLAGVEPMVAMFETIGLGQWFRYLTGGLEVTGAILLLIPTTVPVGGSLLAVVVASRRAFPRDTRPRLNGGR